MADNDLSWIRKELEKSGSLEITKASRAETQNETGGLAAKILTGVLTVAGLIVAKLLVAVLNGGLNF